MRRCLVRALLAVALLGMIGCRSEPETIPPPSIFVLMVDTLRADYLGAHGFEGPISPNLDRLAAESIVFDRCWSVAPWTKPAIASLFTGLDPAIHQVLTQAGRYGAEVDGRRRGSLETDVLPEAAVTLAETLKEKGYATAAFVANPWINAKHGFDQGFDRFDDRFAGNATPASVVIDAAERWLARRRQREQPVFVYLHFMDVHDPYDAPDDDVAALRSSPSLGSDRTLVEKQLPPNTVRHMRLLRLPWVSGPEVYQLREWRARYAGGVRAFDQRIGPFLESLRDAGWLDRSVVILTSDHGEELFEHGGWVHGTNLYEHQLLVPFFVRLPGARHGGRRVSDLVSLVDLMPTAIALAGGEAPADLSGMDLSPLFEPGGSIPPRDVLFASGVKDRPTMYAVRSMQHKLIQDVGEVEGELFDLATDPGEQANLVTRLPSVAFALGDHLDRHLAAAARHAGVGRARAVIGTDVEERLRALGYLD